MSSQFKSFKKNSLVYGIGNISVFVIKFFLVPLYTFHLTQSELGAFDLLASTAPILAIIFGLHIEMSLLRWMLEKPPFEKQKKIFSNSVFVFLLGMLLFISIFFLLTNLFEFEIFNLFTKTLVLFYILALWVYTFLKQSIRSIYSSKEFVITDIIYTLMYLSIILFLLLYLKIGVEALLIGQVISVALLLFYWLGIKHLYRFFDFKLITPSIIKAYLHYAVPLIPNSINLWGLNTFVKYIILAILGVAANGIFAVAFKIAFAIQLINGILNLAWQDKAIASYGEADFGTKINTYFNKVFGIFSSVTLLVIAFQRPLILYFVDESFYESSLYVWILGLGFLFMGLAAFLGIIYQCEKKTLPISISSIVASILLFVSGFFLIKPFGLYGASVAFLIGNIALFVYRFIDINRSISLSLSITQMFAFGGVIASVVYFRDASIFLYVLIIFVVMIYALFYNKDLVLDALKRLKQ